MTIGFQDGTEGLRKAPENPAFVTRQEGRRESGHHRKMKTGFERHGAILHERQLPRRSEGPRSPRRGAPTGPDASVSESIEGHTFLSAWKVLVQRALKDSIPR